MRNVITNISYDEKKGRLKLLGYIDEGMKSENFRIAFRERNDEKYGIVSKIMICTECNWDGLNFEAIVDFNDFREWRNNVLLDLYLIDDRFKKYKFKNENISENNINIFINKKFLNCELITKEESIYIKIKENIVFEDININIIENKNIELGFKLRCNEEQLNSLSEVSLVVRERLTKEIFSYNNFADFKIQSNGEMYKVIITNDDIMEKFFLKDKMAFDFFIIIKSNDECLEIPFKSPNNFNRRIELDEYYYGKIYCNYKKGLAMIVSLEGIKAEVNHIEFNGKSISLSGNIETFYDQEFLKAKAVIVEPKMKSNYNSLVPVSKKYLVESDSYKFLSVIDINDVLKHIPKYNEQVIGIYIQIENIKNNNIYKIPFKVNKNNSSLYQKKPISDEYEFSIIKLNEEIAIKLNEKVKEVNYDTIKIAVLGSCLSRLVFSSKEFFNPDYKSKYRVVNTMFHTSLVSLFSEKLDKEEMIDDKYLQYLHSEVLREYIRKDARKIFFDEIRESKPDFLIIDLYQDAVRDLIVFKNNKILSAGINLRESEYLDTIKEKADIITHSDANEFLEYWEEAIRKFAKEISKYIDESRIIINAQQSINQYIDSEGNIKNYKSLDQFVQRNNYFFEYMSKSLINILPKAKIINLNSLNYKAYALHPEGNTPTHYESQYYKDFMSKLDSIVLKVLLKEGKIKLN